MSDTLAQNVFYVFNYRVSQNYPNMQFFAIFATAMKPLMFGLPKFAEILIESQS